MDDVHGKGVGCRESGSTDGVVGLGAAPATVMHEWHIDCSPVGKARDGDGSALTERSGILYGRPGESLPAPQGRQETVGRHACQVIAYLVEQH